jgi:ABC-type uncharacterized transport system ATPase subunit
MARREHDVALSAEGLKKMYPTATHALRGVNVQFRADEIHAIAGVNGVDEGAEVE